MVLHPVYRRWKHEKQGQRTALWRRALDVTSGFDTCVEFSWSGNMYHIQQYKFCCRSDIQPSWVFCRVVWGLVGNRRIPRAEEKKSPPHETMCSSHYSYSSSGGARTQLILSSSISFLCVCQTEGVSHLFYLVHNYLCVFRVWSYKGREIFEKHVNDALCFDVFLQH